MTARHVPYSVRRGIREPFDYFSGVPEHIRHTLWDWVDDVCLDREFGEVNGKIVDRIVTSLKLPVTGTRPEDRYVALRQRLQRDHDEFLDVIDLLLHASNGSRRQTVANALDDGMSEHQVNLDTGALEPRLLDETRREYRSALDAGDAAADHIAEAWRMAFGRKPDAKNAWHAATSAVEALLGPIVIPNDPKGTLGKMIQALKDKPEKWTFAIALDGAEDRTARGIIPYLEGIGYGPGRHGTDARVPTIEQARAIVQLAVTVTEWLRARALVRNTHPDTAY